MGSSNEKPCVILEVCSKSDHFFRMPYCNRDKANMAANGLVGAMREGSPTAVCVMWENGTFATVDGVADIKVPVFAIRASEIASACLREVSSMGHDDGGWI
jgi:hypothetical protein